MATTTKDFTALAGEAQKQALSALAESQELSLQALESAVRLVPKDVPFRYAASIPSPTQAIEASFGFAGKVLEQQRAYALRLTEVLTTGAQAAKKA
jgi:hypothetical protein